MKFLHVFSLAGFALFAACGDQVDSSTSSDENPPATREQLLKEVVEIIHHLQLERRILLQGEEVQQKLQPQKVIVEGMVQLIFMMIHLK